MNRANRSAAQSNVPAAIPSAEAYFSDQQTYAGMTAANLRTTYDSGPWTDVVEGPAAGQTLTDFCLQATPTAAASRTTSAARAASCPTVTPPC